MTWSTQCSTDNLPLHTLCYQWSCKRRKNVRVPQHWYFKVNCEETLQTMQKNTKQWHSTSEKKRTSLSLQLCSSYIFWNRTNGRAPKEEVYTNRKHRSCFLHLFTELFYKDIFLTHQNKLQFLHRIHTSIDLQCILKPEINAKNKKIFYHWSSCWHEKK